LFLEPIFYAALDRYYSVISVKRSSIIYIDENMMRSRQVQ